MSQFQILYLAMLNAAFLIAVALNLYQANWNWWQCGLVGAILAPSLMELLRFMFPLIHQQ